MAAPPNSLIIFPDSDFVGTGDGPILSYDGGALPAGIQVGAAPPRSTNRGAVQVVQSGVPSAPTEITYRVVASGSIDNQGAWAWKLASETEPAALSTDLVYRGENDIRYSWAAHDPHQAPGGVDASNQVAHLYSRVLGREFSYRQNFLGTQVEVAYRDVDGHEYSSEAASAAAWTLTDCTNTATSDFVYSSLFGICVEEMRDGTLVMITDGNGDDVTVYHSTDGINWTPVVEDVIARFSYWGTGNGLVLKIRLARSADYLCLCFTWYDASTKIDASANHYVRSLVSADRGASWSEITTSSAQLIADLNVYLGDSGTGDQGARSLFDVGGLDDAAGTFVLALIDEDSGQTIKIFTAIGSQPWIARSDLYKVRAASTAVYSLTVGRAAGWFHLFSWDTNGATTWWDPTHWIVEPENFLDPNQWRRTSSIFGSLGAIRYVPQYASITDIGGNYGVLSFALSNLSDGGPPDTSGGYGVVYLRLGGWDQLPIEERDHKKLSDKPDYMHQPGYLEALATNFDDYRLVLIGWDSWMGRPTPVAGNDCAATTPWSRTYQNVADMWQISYWNMTDVAAVNNQWINSYTDTSPTYNWCFSTSRSTPSRAGCCLEVIVRVPLGGSMTGDRVAVRIRGDDAANAGTGGVDFSLRFSSTQVSVFDYTAAGFKVVATNVSGLDTRFHKFRLGVIPEPWNGNQVSFALWVRDEETAGAEWSLVGSGTFANTSTHGLQQIEWGRLTTLLGTGREVDWRSVRILGPHDAGATRVCSGVWAEVPGTSPDEGVLDLLRGRPVRSDPVLLQDGVFATVTGGGAFQGDLYDGEIDFAYHPRNITRTGSPQVQYRSATPTSGTTSVQIDYDAGWSSAGQRFAHDAIGVFGFNAQELTVIYADDSGFTTGLETHTIDTTRAGPLLLDGAIGDAVIVAQSDPNLPAIGEIYSEPNGGVQHYLRVTALGGSTTTTALGYVWKVRYDFDAATSPATRRFRVESGGEDLTGWSLTGSTAIIYADRAVLRYDTATAARYMRLSVAATLTSDANQVRLGTILPGVAVAVNPPLDWTHSDAEDPNVSLVETRGRIRWGYPEGPPRRTWEGRIVGDVAQLRRQCRGLLGALAQHSANPLVLVTDDADLANPEKVVLGRVSGTTFENEGWMLDSSGRWIPIGDMKLSVSEEV